MQVWQLNSVSELLFGDGGRQTGKDRHSNKKAILMNSILPNMLGSMVEPFSHRACYGSVYKSQILSHYLTVIGRQQVVQMDWLGAQLGYRVTLNNSISLTRNYW
jgi:hypothetical protein